MAKTAKMAKMAKMAKTAKMAKMAKMSLLPTTTYRIISEYLRECYHLSSASRWAIISRGRGALSISAIKSLASLSQNSAMLCLYTVA